jgi:hypothetical protein
VAALCFARRTAGPGLLLITSGDTGHWVISKGWLMEGKTDLPSGLVIVLAIRILNRQLIRWQSEGV